METTRGGLSTAAVNGNIYALGGTARKSHIGQGDILDSVEYADTARAQWVQARRAALMGRSHALPGARHGTRRCWALLTASKCVAAVVDPTPMRLARPGEVLGPGEPLSAPLHLPACLAQCVSPRRGCPSSVSAGADSRAGAHRSAAAQLDRPAPPCPALLSCPRAACCVVVAARL